MTPSQNDRVLALARQRGPHGFAAVEFQPPSIADGGTPIWRVAARIDNLKRRGCVFTSARLSDGTARYTLVSEPAVEQASGVDCETEAAGIGQSGESGVNARRRGRLTCPISTSPEQPSPAPAEPLFDTRAYQDQAAA